MKDSNTNPREAVLTKQAIEVAIRVGIVLLLVVWGMRIVAPFINPVVWGVILAVAFYPLFLKLCARFGNRRKLVGAAFILVSIGIFIVPAAVLVHSSIDGVQALTESWKKGELHIPPPEEKVRDWPVVGEKVHELWTALSENLRETAAKFAPELKKFGSRVVGMVANLGGTMLGFTFSLVIAGVLMIRGETCKAFLRNLFHRLVGERGPELIALITGTIRGVALGVVGTAFIQAAASAIGMILVGVPMPALWAFLVLMVAIMQLPPLLVLGPVAAWVFSANEGIAATLFLVGCLVINFGDGFLKPLLMGRGVDAPMLVILVGALGGMIMSGIMGLFVGAVVVTLLYRLFIQWLDQKQAVADVDPGEPGTTSPPAS